MAQQQSLETINMAEFQALLFARRMALLARIDEDALAKHKDDAGSEGARDSQDAGDSSVYEVAQSARLENAQNASHRIRLIDAALARIFDGTYGVCIDCGEPINERRLKSVPEAARCKSCQELLDKQQGQEHHATL